MAKIPPQTIDFIRKATHSAHDPLLLAGLHTLEGVTDDCNLMMYILRLALPTDYEDWSRTFHSCSNSNQRFVWVWVLARLAELDVEWAKSLTELSIPGGNLYRLPYNMGSLYNLQLLDVSRNHLNELPKSMHRMHLLKRLYIHDNEFSYIPDWIENLELDLLYAVGNPLRQIPKGLQAFAMDDELWLILHDDLLKLENVRSMLFQSLSFPCDHSWLKQQRDLKKIVFSDCFIWRLPRALEHCRSLEFLKVTGAEEFELGDEIAFFSQLRSLSLEFGTLRNLPKGIGHCHELRQLQVAYHELTRVPSSLKRLKKLEKLNLSGNTIHSVPQWLGQLKMLRKLNLRQNNLSELPSKMSRLSGLEVLDLSDNQFNTIPDCLFTLSGLRTLNLSLNSIPSGDIFKLQCALPDCDIHF